VVSEVRQVPDNCWPSEVKCRSRIHYYLADHEAVARQAGSRAILLDQEGYVAEATSANVLVYRELEGLSSPPDDHILVGISLGVVHELAGKLGVPFMRRRMTVEDLLQADEVMLASTSVCLLPVVSCDGRAIGPGMPGPMHQRLLSAWGDMVGLGIAEQARRFA
jgi:branched-subunit amino acid aminotransferase/4-amino-4-deoxychorismate lyase